MKNDSCCKEHGEVLHFMLSNSLHFIIIKQGSLKFFFELKNICKL